MEFTSLLQYTCLPLNTMTSHMDPVHIFVHHLSQHKLQGTVESTHFHIFSWLLSLFSKPEAGGNDSHNDFHYQYAEDSMLVLHKCIPQGRLCLRCGYYKWTLWDKFLSKKFMNIFHSGENLGVAHTDTKEGTDVTG